MRTRLVVWGNNAKEERVLLAVSLNAEENKVDIWSIPEKDIPEEFYNKMMSQWREGQDFDLPSSTEHRLIELTMADGILPEDLKVEKSDIIQRAQMEWHFVVLSTKLYKNFKHELEDLTDKVKRLEAYQQPVWDELKQTWANIQQHIIDKNIFKDHGDSLREKSNSLFDELKKLRSVLSAELNQKSKEVSNFFLTKITEIDQKIQAGALLKPLFDQLVTIQSDLKGKSFQREDREIILSKLNEAFKAIRDKREKRDANREQNGSGDERLTRRYEGLLGAIQKMEQSIDFERKNIDFENRRIATTTGQLEAQIRVAKIKMIEERMKSKQEKIKELYETKEKLEVVIEKVKKRDDKLKQRQERNNTFQAEKEKVKAKISETIHQAQDQIPEELQEKLSKAAEEIKSTKKPAKKKPKIVSEIEENHVSEVSDTEQIEPKEQEISSDLSQDSSPEPDVQAPTENLHADQSSDMNPTEEE
ncbi:MAG: hypothetical protein IPO86_14450 [Saprospiraceae bacterium]|nr:hypothetical protein [Saprospiraceae bacterium]MBK9729305.1 hypothetical protein [Saprospiraceae bacterium]